MERIYEFLNENDLGYRVYIGSDKSVYMSYEDAIEYLEGKEVEVDAICDGETTVIPGIMEHIERAGVHSGDYVEPDNSAVQIIVNDKEVCMVAL